MPGPSAVVIGGGPAGLMAAEQLAGAGIPVQVFDAMPSVGRKFLRAGIGGLNITHSEGRAAFRARYGSAQTVTDGWLDVFDAQAVLSWCSALGIDTFVGSSGRVFPEQKKAAPLLRRWLHRLREQGVTFYTRHRWEGWDERGNIIFDSPGGKVAVAADVVVLACGGGSWSRLGSDGRWMALLAQRGIACEAFLASNCGFEYAWSADMLPQFGRPLKNIGLSLVDVAGQRWQRKGEAMVSRRGLEGSLIYAASALIRDHIIQTGSCQIFWDLFPDHSEAQLVALLDKRKSGDSLSNSLRKMWKLDGSKLALLKTLTRREEMLDQQKLPALVKALPQTLLAARPLDEAISTAGGVALTALDGNLMLRDLPGVFCAGEMLDWEAPTGGYLLTACFASGVVAGNGAVGWCNGLASQH